MRSRTELDKRGMIEEEGDRRYLGIAKEGKSLSLNTKDLGQQSMNPKFFMDRLASIRKELGLESIGANDGDNSQDMDPDGRISSGLYGNTVMDFTTKEGGQEKGDSGTPEGTASEPQQGGGGGISHTDLNDIRKRLEAIKSAQMRG
ncbi:hypothetical protein ACTXT7_003451 [Hymenolepis weldensis]